MTFNEIIDIRPYSLDKDNKEKMLTQRLGELTKFHYENCREYSQMMDSNGFDLNNIYSYKDIPFIPVRLFKERSLKSVTDNDIVKTMTSSGTSGQAVSKIYLDKTTSANQQKAMVKIVSDFTGSSRMPMIIIDCPSVIKDRKMFSARGAGILGFSIFGSKKIYALDDDMHLNIDQMREFIEENKDQKILLFGFTFMIWQHFYKELVRIKNETGETLDLSNAILIHGGGWKKLLSEAVSQDEFKNRLNDVCKISSVHDYYGMVEQTGCIYMQCECGHLHSSIFSDVIIRKAEDFSECEIGEKGIIQVVSTIPESYPGHSLLTEDEGMILGEDDCPCGRKGKYFKIFGRLKDAEIRGCSDTYATTYSRPDGESSFQNKIDLKKKIKFLIGDESILSEMYNVHPHKPFEDATLDFLNDLSKELMGNPRAKMYPDVVTLGFWLRKSSVNKMKERHMACDGDVRVGRGVAFHIAPSNVPVNFAYSLFTGIICGNANIVRVPSKDFPQVSIICDAINNVLDKHKAFKQYICLVKYDRDADVNQYLSEICDVRVIWGGDETINEIRRAALPTRATEITFADRYSIALIDADYYLNLDNTDRVAADFYNDTYLSDQNACTSPKIVVWTGSRKEEAKQVFWDKLQQIVEKRYHFEPVMAVDKLSLMYLAATSDEIGTRVRKNSEGNLVFTIQTDCMKSDIMKYRGKCGYFYEFDCKDILEIRDVCNDTRCQTIGIIGEKEMIYPLLMSGIKGIDRVVNVGHTMDFDLNWDGYNLVERMTRTIMI